MLGIAFYNEDFFTVKQDDELYAEELKRLLMTNPGERVGQPFFGIGLRNMLFELADDKSADIVKNRIIDQAETYLPMLTLLSIETEIENNSFYVTVRFLKQGDLPQDSRLLVIEFEDEVAE